MAPHNAQHSQAGSRTLAQNLRKFFSDNAKLLLVLAATVVIVVGAFVLGFIVGGAKQLVVAGAVVAAVAKLSEILAKTVEIQNANAKVRDGFKLFT